MTLGIAPEFEVSNKPKISNPYAKGAIQRDMLFDFVAGSHTIGFYDKLNQESVEIRGYEIINLVLQYDPTKFSIMMLFRSKIKMLLVIIVRIEIKD
eukprot:SAG31_NODE_20776_length_565_cov_1.414163_1_plen_96_part_00